MTLYNDPMMKLIILSHLKKAIWSIEFNTLNLKYLPLLKQEIEILIQKITNEND